MRIFRVGQSPQPSAGANRRERRNHREELDHRPARLRNLLHQFVHHASDHNVTEAAVPKVRCGRLRGFKIHKTFSALRISDFSNLHSSGMPSQLRSRVSQWTIHCIAHGSHWVSKDIMRSLSLSPYYEVSPVDVAQNGS